MHKKLCLIIPAIMILTSCGALDGFGDSTRRVQSGSPKVSTITPSIILEQELKNCSDETKCKQEPLGTPKSGLNINSLIIADSETFNSQNIKDAPAIVFNIADIDNSELDTITYTYIKKDQLGNTLVQLEPKQVIIENSNYYVPIHTSTMGIGIMTSASYEQHLLNIKIKTADNLNYNYDINFTLLSTHKNPVTISRSTTVADSSYYKMDQDLSDFVIDSIDISNLLPYDVTVSGSINVSNSTIAILSNTHRVQTRTPLIRPQNYPWDLFAVTTNTNVEYIQAVTTPTFRLMLVKNEGEPVEFPISGEAGINSNILNFSDLTLLGNEKIRMDLLIHVDTNNSILGPNGQQEFVEGQSICSDANPNSECKCFRYVPDLHATSTMAYGMMGCGVFMTSLKDRFAPDCPVFPDGACISTFMTVVQYPKNLLALAGRHHRTNTSYTITSWLKGYQDYDDLGTYIKTFDTLETIKGYVDYAAVNQSMSYYGYIPGQI